MMMARRALPLEEDGIGPRQELSGKIATRPEGALVVDRRRSYQQVIMHRLIRILGIDPGLRRTGWGMIAIEGNRLGFLACGSLATDDKATLAERLVTIHDGLRRVVADHAPDEAAVEMTFVNKDAAATLKLGQARGIALLVPAIAGCRSPNTRPTW